MTYMTKAELREHLLSAPAGTTPGGIVASLRAQGVVMEGDPTPAQSNPVNTSINQAKDQIMQPNPADGTFLGNTLRGANREVVSGLSGLGDRLAHPSKLLGDAKNLLSGAAKTATGLGEDLFQGVTGKQVPQFNPDGTTTMPVNGTPEQQTTKSVLDSAQGALMHPIKTFENHPITSALVIAPALRAIAGDTAAVGKATSMAQEAKNYIGQKSVDLGVIDPTRGPLESKAAVQNLEPIIKKGIEKSISPSVIGKKTIGQVDKYYKDASLAVHSIVNNKNTLQLTDEAGLPAVHNLPQNLKQFSEAVDQTKKAVFDQYDALQKQAGLAGATVDTKSVAHDLVSAMADPKFAAIEDQNPAISNYILDRATALESRGSYTPEQAQIAIKNYNDSLSSFYKNPNMENFQKANVDAMIANKLRDGLDKSIMDSTDQVYQPLKTQYGALKSVEKDVLNSAMRNARKNTKGLVDFSDIFSGGDLVKGLVSHNPALLAKGAAQIGIKQYIKFLNDPNSIVKNMFQKVDSVLQNAAKYKGAIDVPVSTPAQ